MVVEVNRPDDPHLVFTNYSVKFPLDLFSKFDGYVRYDSDDTPITNIPSMHEPAECIVAQAYTSCAL